jgi:hypothetical protein
MDSVYGFVVGKYEPNWTVVDSLHHSVFPKIPFFLSEFSIFFITAIDPCLQFCGYRLMVYFWGTKATHCSFNNCSQLLTFNLPCCLLLCFRYCHHAATIPQNVCTTKETRCSSGTPLNSKTSSTANIQYQNSDGCNIPGNSRILSLDLSTH